MLTCPLAHLLTYSLAHLLTSSATATANASASANANASASANANALQFVYVPIFNWFLIIELLLYMFHFYKPHLLIFLLLLYVKFIS